MKIQPLQVRTPPASPPPRAVRVDAPVASPSDSFQFSPVESTAASEPKQAKPLHPRRNDYMWEGAAIGGWVGAVLGAVVSFGPMPRLLGLEPPPARPPEVRPLEFDWAGCSDADFAQHCQRLEVALTEGKEAGKERLGGGGNRSYLVELDTGPLTIWKPVVGQVPGKIRETLPKDQNEGKVERAAYLVDKALGHLARVPVASGQGLEGRDGTLALFVPKTVPAKALGERGLLMSLLKEDDKRRITLFDHVIGNLDRHGGNWLIDPRGRAIPIDHGLAFPERNQLQGNHNFDFDEDFKLNADETARLKQFLAQRSVLEPQLRPLVSARGIDCMYERVERMLELGKTTQEWRD